MRQWISRLSPRVGVAGFITFLVGVIVILVWRFGFFRKKDKGSSTTRDEWIFPVFLNDTAKIHYDETCCQLLRSIREEIKSETINEAQRGRVVSQESAQKIVDKVFVEHIAKISGSKATKETDAENLQGTLNFGLRSGRESIAAQSMRSQLRLIIVFCYEMAKGVRSKTDIQECDLPSIRYKLPDESDRMIILRSDPFFMFPSTKDDFLEFLLSITPMHLREAGASQQLRFDRNTSHTSLRSIASPSSLAASTTPSLSHSDPAKRQSDRTFGN